MPKFTELKSSICDVRIWCQWCLSVSEPPTLFSGAIQLRQFIIKMKWIKSDVLTDANL